ncbi:protein YqbG [Bacillus cereus group sp. Bce040]|uniref:protein YqbG n=1 Tax=Bacillus cereus group sp. Bce040 TaxID=3445229 RepID=UPI003F1E5E50
MALITAQELIDYTVLPEVKKRPVPLLEQDILEAETEINNIPNIADFADKTEFPVIPEVVKLACKKLAQYYAYINADTTAMKGIKSESVGGGDYSYTKDSIAKPDVLNLLKGYIPNAGKKKVTFKMRAI